MQNKAVILYGGLGDIAMLSALSNLMKKNKINCISLITSENFVDFAKKYGSFCNVIGFNKKNDTIINEINQCKFDIIFDLHNSSFFERAYISFLSNINVKTLVTTKERAKYVSNNDLFIKYATKRIYKEMHNSTYYFKRAEINCKINPNSLTIFPNNNDLSYSKNIKIDNKRKRIGLIVKSRYPHKELSIRNWELIINSLNRENTDIFIFCATYEKEEVVSLAKSIDAIIIHYNKVTFFIKDLLTMHLIISIDTGLKHIASYLSIPVFSFYGHSSPNIWGTLKKNEYIYTSKSKCSPCNNPFECPIQTNDCMDTFDFNLAINEINKML